MGISGQEAKVGEPGVKSYSGDPMAADMDRRRTWHLDRGLNPAYLIPLISGLLGGLAWAGAVNSTNREQDIRIGTVEKKVETSDKNNREDFKLVLEKMDKLNDKMDKIGREKR